jgi:hypothetical protein
MARGPQLIRCFCSGTSNRQTALRGGNCRRYPDGSCARRNAQKRAARADVKALVAELRAPIAEKLEITLAVLIERADQIYRQAMLAGQFNAAISALKELGVLSGKRIERGERGEPGEFDRMSDGELRQAVADRAEQLGFVRKKETQH